MSNYDLILFIRKYYPETSEISLNEIEARTESLTDEQRETLKSVLVEEVSNRFGRISVKEIFDAVWTRVDKHPDVGAYIDLVAWKVGITSGRIL